MLLSEVSRLYEEEGHLELASNKLQSLLQSDPLDEEAHRSLMRVYARRGSRQKAKRQYQACREILARELGVEPSEETEALRQAIMEGKFSPVRVADGLQWP